MNLSRDEKIRTAVLRRYDAVARSPRASFSYATGREGLMKLGYEKEFVDLLPLSVAESFCGVADPLMDGKILPGETVLDVGCGAGVDLIRAALLVGPVGKVYGVDLTASMVQRAMENIALMKIVNARAEEADAESLPFPDETFDVVTSNGVINLSPRKGECFAEIRRVLKPGGRLYLADMILEDDTASNPECDLDAWSA
jgi:arsenite methyltransferase